MAGTILIFDCYFAPEDEEEPKVYMVDLCLDHYDTIKGRGYATEAVQQGYPEWADVECCVFGCYKDAIGQNMGEAIKAEIRVLIPEEAKDDFMFI